MDDGNSFAEGFVMNAVIAVGATTIVVGGVVLLGFIFG